MRTKAQLMAGVALLIAATPVLSACYTDRGAGEDLSAAGKSIEHSADKNTNYCESSGHPQGRL